MMAMKSYHLVFVLFLYASLFSQAQEKENLDKLSFTGDFRFRIEQDWNSRKSDGTYRTNRSRLRYRARFGMNYQQNSWASFGLRLRTGYREKQQDPQLTIGDGFNEFNSVPIGFEKLFFRAHYKWFDGWVGKNTFPFEKQNELFWSDNVYPEGIFVSASFKLIDKLIENIKISAAHFILTTSNATFAKDSYIQVIQLTSSHWNRRLSIFPTFYYFNKMPNIPDGNHTYRLNYSIFHLGTNAVILEKPRITLGLDWYKNLENFKQNDSIPTNLRDQKKGLITSLLLGKLKNKGDFIVGAYYTYLERYAAVDFLAQNDWVRWDYSNQGSPDGRLTNFKGLEIMAGYRINKSLKLKMRYFMVDQIVPYGITKENGDRIRLDLDIGF